MLSKKNSNASTNLSMLSYVARQLNTLNNDVVYLGGCATALFITDTAAPDVRATIDVDCIVDVISLRHYHKLEKQLNDLGFKKSIEDDIICRWRFNHVILDIMPTDEKILGFGNRWYKPAIQHANTHHIADDLIIKSVTAPYFLATKLEAFKTRGNNDFLGSHDFEDIITVIDGREEIVPEVFNADTKLKNHLAESFTNMLKQTDFHTALPGHLNHSSISEGRTKIVLKRIEQMANALATTQP